MELIIEFIIECFLEGISEISKSNRIPKWIRTPCLIMLCTAFIMINGIIIYIAVLAMKDNIYIGISLFLIALFFIIIGFIKAKRIYKEKKEQTIL